MKKKVTGPKLASPGPDPGVKLHYMKEERYVVRHFGWILLILCLPIAAWTKIEFDSSKLVMKNADQISEFVREKIRKAQEIQAQQEGSDDEFLAEPQAVEELKEALRIVLARPDQDGTRANAFSRLRRELVDLNVLDKVLGDLTSEAIAAIRSSSTPPARVATYVVLLENLMAEIKPEIDSRPLFKKLIIEIRDADLVIPAKVKTQEMIRSMSRPVSPSETAAKIIPKEDKKK